MSNTKNLLAVATTFAHSFEAKTRDNGAEFTSLRIDAPTWAVDIMHAAHDNGEFFPNDYSYDFAHSIAYALVDAIESERDLDEAMDEELDCLVPVYNMGRLQWLSSNLRRAFFVDDAVDNHGWPGDLFTAIGWGILEELRMIWHAIVEGLEAQAERLEDA